MDLIQMSLMASIIILITIVVRAVFINKLPKKIFILLWIIAMIRLLIPYTIGVKYSVYNLVSHLSYVDENNANATQMEAVTLGEPAQDDELDSNMITENIATNINKSIVDSIVEYLKVVWLLGVVVSAMYFSIGYIKGYRKFNINLPIDSSYIISWKKSHTLRWPFKRRLRVATSAYIDSPISYGILKPTILIPENFNIEDTTTLRYVLEHEYIHITRFDQVLKMLMSVALCVHWFNPMVWIMYLLCNRDIELSCDEGVILNLGIKERKSYAQSLVNLEAIRSGFSPLESNFSREALEERIVAIMKLKKFSKVSIITGAVFVGAVTICFATTKTTTPAVLKVDKATVSVKEGDSVVAEFEESASAEGDSALIHEGEDGKSGVFSDGVNPEELFKEYKKFGLEDKAGTLYYKGQVVRYFLDGYERDGSVISRYQAINGAGTIDVHTVRNDKKNADGSTTLFTDIVAIEPYSQEEFDNRTLGYTLDVNTDEPQLKASVKYSVDGSDIPNEATANIAYTTDDETDADESEETNVNLVAD